MLRDGIIVQTISFSALPAIPWVQSLRFLLLFNDAVSRLNEKGRRQKAVSR